MEIVVSYWNSTSNHNQPVPPLVTLRLYLIEILHQTTTPSRFPTCVSSCILLKFYIKPQRIQCSMLLPPGCILLKFYIKPQLFALMNNSHHRCILLKFYIKPQRLVRYLLDFSVLRRLSGRKTERENSVEVSLMCFLYFKERKYCFFRKIPTAAACPVLPVRSCPRSWECLHTVCLSQTEYS